MPDLSSFTQGTSDVAASDFLIGYVSAAGPGSERRWTAQDLTTGLLSLVGATPAELAHLSGTTGNIQSQINTVQASIDDHEVRVDNPHTVTATQVGLGSVDNTSDADKPVSTLQAAAIGVVQADVNAHEVRVDNPHAVTATQVGLGNVDNTSDANKPVSTLQQAAIDAAGGGAFDADANTQITPATPIVLDQATGDEAALTLDYTTNKATSGDDTGLLINQTDTNSPGTSNLLDLQVGGVSKFSVSNAGDLEIAAGAFLRAAANTLAQRNGVNAQTYNLYNTYTSATNYERAHVGWNDTADTFVIGTEAGSGGGAVRPVEVAAPYLTLKQGADANQYTQSGFKMYGFDDASNNYLQIGVMSNWRGLLHSNAGFIHASSLIPVGASRTGSLGGDSNIWGEVWGAEVNIDQGTLTDDAQALNITSTWNDAADAFTLIKADVTDTASAAGSKLMDLQVGGASKFSVDATGGVVLPNLPTADPLNAGELWNDSGALKVSAG